MFLDNQNLFSDAQEIAATANSTNVLDFGAMGKVAYNPQAGSNQSLSRRKGVGMVVPLLVQAVEAFAGAVTTVTFIIQGDSTEDFSSGNVKDFLQVVVPVAELKAGYQLPVDKLPRNIDKRYLRMRYVLDAAATGGKITAGLVLAVDGGYKG